MLPQCDIKLKPIKIPKNSKKIYRGIFIRSLKRVSHSYHLDGLYLVSIPLGIDVYVWIDKNYELIKTRKWIDEHHPELEEVSLFELDS